MLKTTLGQLLVNRHLPEDMRDYNRELGKGGIAKLFQTVAEKHPDKYRQIAKDLSDVGRDAATSTGGFSFSLRHMKATAAAKRLRAQLNDQIEAILDGAGDDNGKEKQITDLLGGHMQSLEKQVFDESQAEGNPLALQILSGARGSPMNLKSLRAGDLLYEDHHGHPIAMPVTRSYSEGLSPAEYWAGAFGARKGTIDTKFATQRSGFMAKQLNQITHRLVTVGDDAEPDETADQNPHPRGLPVNTDDPDNEGALLAIPTAGFPRNTVLTGRVLRELKQQGHDRLLVRSPTVGGPGSGVYGRDVGIRERGHMPKRGDFVGIAAGQALSEKLTQSQLSSKHTGGVAGQGGAVSGFKLVNQLVQTPKTFRGGAAHAQVDGRVEKIEDAPQGGQFVTVGGQRHYVAQGFALKVKPGDDIEAGDVLSEGLPNPAEVVQHKGIGEGRRYFTQQFLQAYKDSGMYAHRRNVELMARGLIDHVRLTDEYGDGVPDDVVPYNALEARWHPRPDVRRMPIDDAGNQYLERPVLHYSVGTKVRPSVIRQLRDYGVRDIDVHPDPPPFEPVMIRGMGSLEHDPDWTTRHLGSNLSKGTLRAVHRGESSTPGGTSFVSAMAFNPVGFGREGQTQGWQADSQKSNSPQFEPDTDFEDDD